MDTPQSDPNRAATIDRLRKLWASEPGKYWDELKVANINTTEVWPDLATTNPVVLPDLDKPEQVKKGKR